MKGLLKEKWRGESKTLLRYSFSGRTHLGTFTSSRPGVIFGSPFLAPAKTASVLLPSSESSRPPVSAVGERPADAALRGRDPRRPFAAVIARGLVRSPQSRRLVLSQGLRPAGTSHRGWTGRGASRLGRATCIPFLLPPNSRHWLACRLRVKSSGPWARARGKVRGSAGRVQEQRIRTLRCR